MDARTVIIQPVVTEKSYAQMALNKYSFRVHENAHKVEIAQAVEKIFGVDVVGVRTMKVRSKPRRRGYTAGRSRSWKKAVVEIAAGQSIELFEGAGAAGA